MSDEPTLETARVIEVADANKSPEELLPLVYNELRRLAQGYLNNERAGHTLPATALVHEAYLRLIGWENATWHNRAHFFAVAASAMRRVLIDHARRRNQEKRRGAARKVQLADAVRLPIETPDVDLLRLNDALDALTKIDRQQSRIVELRFFAGMTVEETAHALQISPATVKRDWTLAKAWLYREINRTNAD